MSRLFGIFQNNNERKMNRRSFKLAIVSGVTGAALLSLNSCACVAALFLSTPSMKSGLSAHAPIMTTAQAVQGGDALRRDVIHLYGKLTQLGKHPRLDDSVDLIPISGDTFKDASVGQTILVRGFFKSDRRHGMERFKLTSAVWYPGIEEMHEAELAKLRVER